MSTNRIKLARSLGVIALALAVAVGIGCSHSEHAGHETAHEGDHDAKPSGPSTHTVGDLLEAQTREKVEAILAKADAVDGTTDKVVTKCPACALMMDGHADHSLEVAEYELHFCSGDCKESFSSDTTKSLLAMAVPEQTR